MKPLATIVAAFVLVTTPVRGLELSLGLNVEDPELRAKPVILLYLSNDRMRPLGFAKMTGNDRYLKNALNGQQYFPHLSSDGCFSNEELAFFDKLPERDKAFLSELGAYIAEDADEFATSQEHGHILRALARRNPRYNAGYLVFRNFLQLAPLKSDSALYFEYSSDYASQESEFESRRRRIPIAELPQDFLEFPYADQALSHPGVLERLLREVEALYPPEKYRYLAVIKSQGGDGMVLTPRYDVFLPDEMDYVKMISKLLERKEELLQGGKAIPNHRGTNTRLSRILGELVGKKDRVGISAARFFEILSKSSGKFPVVFLDVNEVNLPESLEASNIGTIFYTSKPVEYSLVDYDDLFSFIGVTTTDLEVRLREFLRDNLPR